MDYVISILNEVKVLKETINIDVIFVLSSDMNVASRFDAYLTNMKMPWEKEAPPTLLAVGCLECWVKTNDENEFKYERMWNKTYPS